MAGTKVIVTGAGKTIEAVTNDQGEYKVTGLPAGDYDAFPEVPELRRVAAPDLSPAF